MLKFHKKLTSSFFAPTRKRDAGQNPGTTKIPLPLRAGDKKGLLNCLKRAVRTKIQADKNNLQIRELLKNPFQIFLSTISAVFRDRGNTINHRPRLSSY